MSKLFYTIKLNEVQTTKKGDFIREYKSNLPHAKEIIDNLCQSWNSINWGEIFDDIFSGNVTSSIMRPLQTSDDGISKVQITTTFKEGFRLSKKRRDAFWDQMEAQMCDGWGEGVFGLINLMEFSDGAFGYTD